MEDLKQQYLDELKRSINLEYRDEIKIAELTENFNGMSIKIRKKEKLQQLEQWAYLSTHSSKRFNSFCYDDDDDEDYTITVTPSLSIEEPDNSLSMGDEHLDTIPATKLDEFINSSVENLIPIPSESEGIHEHMCDVPFHDNSQPLDASAIRPLFFTIKALEAEDLELRRASLALTLLYLASKSLVGLSLVRTILKVLDNKGREEKS
uniref:Uncharacterized protein n=1 Tax=Tanacetum cinerariifolium TaxID=118510 RepID=A0A6L2NG25_TANCI|nr:hypothetical protein [Tanacetum cinerariifolium]